jgi:hypothetical protein
MATRPDSIEEAWQRLARGDFAGAAEISRRVLARAPQDVSALSCLAMSNWQLGGDISRSIADLRQAARLAPEVSSIRHNLATLLASNGEHEAARESFRKAIELKPDDTEAFYGLSQSTRFTEEDGLVRQMLDQYAGGRLTPQAREFACFGLAKAYADLGSHERAMHFCLEANWLGRRPYEAERPRAELAELRRLAASGAFRHLVGAPAGAGPRPVFIVGMPRSGTTLVESILARHPEVLAGGEMLHMANVERTLLNWARSNKGFTGGPHELLKAVPAEYFARNAEAVRGKVAATAAGRRFSVFTDKLPENTQRLGLIQLLFPEARVLYVRRHALDCCLSNLFQRFAYGHGFTFQQDLLGERYRQVTETMALWKRTLRLPILDVSYEALVGDPEPVIRRMVAFAGLDWNEACLTPEQAGRRILTASQFQVKQPINRRSVDRWRPYADWLGPLINALGGLPWIDAEAREMQDAATG